MDFSLSQEQQLLRDSVRKFVEKQYTFSKRRALMQTTDGFSREHWATFAELGWTAIPFAEQQGGLGGSAVDLCVVMEELGNGLVLEPYFPTVVFAGAVLAAANQPHANSLLQRIIDGTLLAAVAWAERESRFDFTQVTTRVTAAGVGYVLNGEKQLVLSGDSADLLIVSARVSGDNNASGGFTLFAVDAKAAGVQRTGYRTVDGLRAADITFSNVMLDADAVVGTVGDGLALLSPAIDRSLVALGAEAVGIMDTMQRQTVAYSKERKQFGVAIGSFQALQHNMVDMLMECELSRSMLYMAAMKLDAHAPDSAKSAAALKAHIGKSGRLVGQTAIQIHGGIGMTDELAISHYFKRLTAINILFGGTDHQLNRYSTL